MNLRQQLRGEECSPTGRTIQFSCAYPKPVVSPLGASLYNFNDALGVSDLTGESEPVAGYNVFPASPARRFHLWLMRDPVTPISDDFLLSSLACTP